MHLDSHTYNEFVNNFLDFYTMEELQHRVADESLAVLESMKEEEAPEPEKQPFDEPVAVKSESEQRNNKLDDTLMPNDPLISSVLADDTDLPAFGFSKHDVMHSNDGLFSLALNEIDTSSDIGLPLEDIAVTLNSIGLDKADHVVNEHVGNERKRIKLSVGDLAGEFKGLKFFPSTIGEGNENQLGETKMQSTMSVLDLPEIPSDPEFKSKYFETLASEDWVGGPEENLVGAEEALYESKEAPRKFKLSELEAIFPFQFTNKKPFSFTNDKDNETQAERFGKALCQTIRDTPTEEIFLQTDKLINIALHNLIDWQPTEEEEQTGNEQEAVEKIALKDFLCEISKAIEKFPNTELGDGKSDTTADVYKNVQKCMKDKLIFELEELYLDKECLDILKGKTKKLHPDFVVDFQKMDEYAKVNVIFGNDITESIDPPRVVKKE